MQLLPITQFLLTNKIPSLAQQKKHVVHLPPPSPSQPTSYRQPRGEREGNYSTHQLYTNRKLRGEREANINTPATGKYTTARGEGGETQHTSYRQLYNCEGWGNLNTPAIDNCEGRGKLDDGKRIAAQTSFFYKKKFFSRYRLKNV